MRCNWRRWLWGLIPLMLLAWAAIYVERDRIQADITERAKSALADSGSRWATVNAEGRDVVLTGRAIQDSDPPRAEQTVRETWGVRVVDNRATLPPTVEPFVWSARRKGDRIRLTGYVPDRTTREAVLGLTRAAMPGVEVVDKLRVARGVKSPDTWLAGLSFALKQLSHLKSGEARFEDLALTINGEAEDAAAYRTVNTALKNGLPKGVTLASAKIGAPIVSPFTWSAQFAGDQLVLAGYVAGGDKVRHDLVAAAKAAAPDANTVDRMEYAEGAPQAWTNIAAALLKELVRLESGTAEMKDTALTVGGMAADEEQAKAIRAALRAAIPQTFTLVDQIRVREVKAPEPAPAPPAPVPTQPETPSVSTVTPAEIPPSTVEEAKAPQSAPVAEGPREAPSQPPAARQEPAPQVPTEPSREAAPAPELPKSEPPAQPKSEPPAQTATAPPATVPEPQQPAPAAPPIVPERPPPAAAKSEPAPPRTEIASAERVEPQTPEVRTCQQELDKITSAGHIHFATDSAKLDNDSYDTLDRLAAAARACPGVRIAIEGHTDAEGRAAYNQRLSVRRARAVVNYLIKAGADQKQFVTVGYGPTRPAAPNDTEENMAKNRRIEFSVRAQ